MEGSLERRIPASLPVNSLDTLYNHMFNLSVVKYCIMGAFTILLWEHCITFSEEVEKMWKPKFSLATILFLVNRYFTLCRFIIVLFFFDAKWKVGFNCGDFFKFPTASTMLSVAIAALIMILRTYALYQGNRYILIGLLTCLAAQFAVMTAVLVDATLLPLPRGIPGCYMAGNQKFSLMFWVAPLVTEGIVFVLTVTRSVQCLRESPSSSLLSVILRDGIMYFVVILGVNLTVTLLYHSAPGILKATGPGFSHVFTNVMVARLQLNLRSKRIRRPRSTFDSTTSTSQPTDPSSDELGSFPLTVPRTISSIRFSEYPPVPNHSTGANRDPEEIGHHCSSILCPLFRNHSRGVSYVSKESMYDFAVGNLGEAVEAWQADQNSKEEQEEVIPQYHVI